MSNRISNFHVPNCDGGGCRSNEHDQVRILPAVSGDGNSQVCWACYLNEMTSRRQQNLTRNHKDLIPVPSWEKLKVYEPVK